MPRNLATCPLLADSWTWSALLAIEIIRLSLLLSYSFHGTIFPLSNSFFQKA